MKISKKKLQNFSKIKNQVLIIFIILFFNCFLYSFNESQYEYIDNKMNWTKIKNPIIDYDNIVFLYHDLYASKIELKSSFDNWKDKYTFKKKSGINWNGLWKLSLPLNKKEFQFKKGKYHYKILVDDTFTHDKYNPNKEKDGFKNYISFFDIKEDLLNLKEIVNPVKDSKKNIYRFIYKGSSLIQVNLVGDFNDWNPYSHPLKYKDKGIWEIKLRLTSGKYYYNFIINNEWKKDVLNPLRDLFYPTFSFFEIHDSEDEDK